VAGDGRAARHQSTRRRILVAARHLTRSRGLAGWSLRDLAAAVGMQAPSLYVYLDSKNSLYDYMFADGYQALLDRIEATPTDGEARELLHRAAHLFFDFCVEDPARYQLLFLRTIPGFTPSPESYALAQAVVGKLADVLQTAGIGSAQNVDRWTAVLTGMATQQISNDPGGDRWEKLLDSTIDLLLPPDQPGSS
jgi:AcrR family transcriptional regulator